MASCPDCGADITHALTVSGDNVPLEKWTDNTGRRYYVTAFGPPDTVERVAESSSREGYPDHRLDCPAHSNGFDY